MKPHDLLVVGGGVNGVGVARDAAGRGLSVCLCEKDDLASHTSSWSSKLIHGGLRYLEHYEFRLVREALIEREVLLRAARHLVRPIEICLPHSPAQRPAWLIRIGLFLYDHLGGRKELPASKSVRLAGEGVHGAPLDPRVARGFTYADCQVDDSRLVIVNALDAKERGARILTRTKCVEARRENGLWRAELERADGERETVYARALVNAAGPWVSDFLDGPLGQAKNQARVRLVKGSHLVTKKLFEGSHGYILQNDDGRIVFALPYRQAYTLIGTTDVPYEGDPAEVAPSEEEKRYLCDLVNGYFAEKIAPEDAVWSFAGVRPLYDDAAADPSAVTRDYTFDLDAPEGGAPLLSIFGGKLTTYRKLAEHALAELSAPLGVADRPWTEGAVLPGGEIDEFEAFVRAEQQRIAFLPPEVVARLARSYGSRIDRVLAGRNSLEALGEPVADGVFECELEYLCAEEWARCADDVLWRRTKLGLTLNAQGAAAVRAWFETRRPTLFSES